MFDVVDLSTLLMRQKAPVDGDTMQQAQGLIDVVRQEGSGGLRRLAEQFDGLPPDASLLYDAEALAGAKASADPETLEGLERVAGRIRRFASAQRDALRDLEVPIPGGTAGHRLVPVDRVGCYAPAGRHPLPSSVLMTALVARVAGVSDVWVASPSDDPIMRVAAAVAGANGFLRAGGAHAVAALAYGTDDVPPMDIVVGPGNRFVTAAKTLVSRDVGIDGVAGPSELVVFADDSARPAWIAADLIAQAEHDPDALPVLVTTSERLVSRVRTQLEKQLADLPTANVARLALANGGILPVADVAAGIDATNRLAPEHVHLHLRSPAEVAERLRHFGSLFIGERAAEVLADYGLGPNHVLPTMGAARRQGGLSVLSFLRAQTWLRMDGPGNVESARQDAEWLAGIEGLEGHRRAAAMRAGP